MNEYGDIYFVMDASFLFLMGSFYSLSRQSFSAIVDTMKRHDKGATSGDVPLYFDSKSRHLFHDRELKDRAIMLCLRRCFTANIVDELRDRISSSPNMVALAPNVLLMKKKVKLMDMPRFWAG